MKNFRIYTAAIALSLFLSGCSSSEQQTEAIGSDVNQGQESDSSEDGNIDDSSSSSDGQESDNESDGFFGARVPVDVFEADLERAEIERGEDSTFYRYTPATRFTDGIVAFLTVYETDDDVYLFVNAQYVGDEPMNFQFAKLSWEDKEETLFTVDASYKSIEEKEGELRGDYVQESYYEIVTLQHRTIREANKQGGPVTISLHGDEVIERELTGSERLNFVTMMEIYDGLEYGVIE